MSDHVTPTAARPDWNQTGIDYRRPLPRPKVRGAVIDFHTHLLAVRHAALWFEACDHYGIDQVVSMTPLEEAAGMVRRWGHRLHLIAVPRWQDPSRFWADEWLRRVEAYYNLGCRILKFHLAPGTMHARGVRLDHPPLLRIVREARDRRMIVMSHVGDPELWYQGRYTDPRYGTRSDHYAMWEAVLSQNPDLPWVGAHLGGNPEDLPRLQGLLDRYPRLSLDCSATRWMVREVCARRDQAREFFLRNQDRLLFGSDQVSGDDRGFGFLASRLWCHRKLWETATIQPTPIHDPDAPSDRPPVLRGLALPDGVLQKLYHDNARLLLESVGVRVGDRLGGAASAA